jgi:hypothetical protein
MQILEKKNSLFMFLPLSVANPICKLTVAIIMLFMTVLRQQFSGQLQGL